MRTIIALAAFLIMSISAEAQDIIKKYETSTDSVNGSVVYKGLIGFGILDKEPSFSWYKSGVDRYKPSKRYVHKLKTSLSKYNIIVVMGTWCGDSKDMIPKLYKVLDATGYPVKEKLVMYGVDRAKTAGHGQEKQYGIEYVPVIILFDGAKEIGRITESVHKSVEADLSAIIRKYEGSK